MSACSESAVTDSDRTHTSRIASICQPVPQRMPRNDCWCVCGIDCVDVLARLDMGNVNTRLPVLFAAAAAGNIGAVKGEGEVVDGTRAFSQGVLAHPVVSVP